jgi:hypothetical protein
MSARRAAAHAAACGLVLLTAGCAARGPVRPGGTAADDPAALTALAGATVHCSPLRTATTEIRLSGRAGPQRIRARLLAGFAEPASVRLEALAPFGAPALVLAADGTATTLYFPREKQVLREAPVASVLEALTGLALDAAELRRMIFGCLRDGVPVAADYRGWQIDYAGHVSGVARQVRVRRAVAAGPIDLLATLGEVEMNIDLDPRAFVVDVPADAVGISLGDLRQSSPLTAR